MPRRAEGWTLNRDPRTGNWIARFRHGGRRYNVSTRETDRARAKQEAARIYAETVSGRRRERVGSAPVRLFELVSEWTAAMEIEVPDTAPQYKMIGFAHIEPYFGDTGRLTEASMADYIRARLRSVQRSTVRAEMTAVRRLCRWLHERGYLETMPHVPGPPRGAKGTVHPVARKRRRVDLTEAEARAIIAELPERSKKIPIRAYYDVMWETGLRRASLDRLRVPEHYSRGARYLTITPEIDKSRYGRPLPLSERARAALDSVVTPETIGLIFGKHDMRDSLRQAAQRAGIEHWDRVSNHDFRHGRLTHLVSTTPDILSVAYLGGHKHVTTTDRYLHPRLRAAEAVIRATDRATAKSGAKKRSERGSA